MSCISFGNIDKSLVIIIIGCIFCFFNCLIIFFTFSALSNDNLIITNIIISLSNVLAVIPLIILKIRSRTINRKNEQKNNNSLLIKLIYIDREKENSKGKWIFILLSAITYLIQSICLVYSIEVKANFWFCYILLASIFYYLIFKIKLYKHHYLSIILIILMGIIIDLVTENLQNDIIDNTIFLTIKIMKEIFFSLHIIITKYVMEKKFVSIYELSFYIGLISLILFIIFGIFDYYFFKLFNFELLNEFRAIDLMAILGVILFQFVINLITYFTAKNNSPCHVFIIYIFSQFTYFFEFKGYKIIFTIIYVIIVLFFSLIFNEIIEINIFGLSYNTKRNIMARAKEESFIRNESMNKQEREESDYSIKLI